MIRKMAVAGVAIMLMAPIARQRGAISSRPDTLFKLATVEAGGKLRLAMSVAERTIDIAAANASLSRDLGLPVVTIPGEMRELIEQYDRVAPRLYQIANHVRSSAAGAAVLSNPSFRAPILYPWNLVNLAANYRAHAEGMSAGQPAGRPGGFNAAAAAEVDPDRDAPVVFAKSPRSCIIGTGEPYYIPPGREKIDWEGELGIVIGKPAYRVDQKRAHDYVFGYTVLYDLSDRGGRTVTRSARGVA